MTLWFWRLCLTDSYLFISSSAGLFTDLIFQSLGHQYLLRFVISVDIIYFLLNFNGFSVLLLFLLIHLFMMLFSNPFSFYFLLVGNCCYWKCILFSRQSVGRQFACAIYFHTVFQRQGRGVYTVNNHSMLVCIIQEYY